MIWLMSASFRSAEAACACVEVAIGEIADGVVRKAGSSALEEPTAVRKHAEIANPRAESSLRRRKARRWRLTFSSGAGLMADLVIFIGLFSFSISNGVRFLLVQVLCQQTHIMLTYLSTVFTELRSCVEPWRNFGRSNNRSIVCPLSGFGDGSQALLQPVGF